MAIARQLFFQAGYAGTSMSQIASAVGGSKTTLYNHFQSKEQLLLAVVDGVVEAGGDVYDTSAQPSEFRAWLAWFGVATVKRITSPDYIALQRLAAAEALRFPDIGKAFDDAITPGYRMAAGIFGEAMDAGLLRRADPAVAIEQFLEMCAGWLLRRTIWNIQPAPSESEIEKSVDAAVSAFMDGYAAKNSP
ncbi:TetR/AcrR family transcriptional regulator [Mesorhizobium amorphae]